MGPKRSGCWTKLEKKRLLETLKTLPLDACEQISAKLKSKSPEQVEQYLDRLKLRVTYKGDFKVPAPIETWLDDASGLVEDDAVDFSTVISQVMSVVSNFEEFPTPAEGVPDYRAIYKYLSQLLVGECPETLRPLENCVLMDLLHSLTTVLATHDTSVQRNIMKLKYMLIHSREKKEENRRKVVENDFADYLEKKLTKPKEETVVRSEIKAPEPKQDKEALSEIRKIQYASLRKKLDDKANPEKQSKAKCDQRSQEKKTPRPAVSLLSTCKLLPWRKPGEDRAPSTEYIKCIPKVMDLGSGEVLCKYENVDELGANLVEQSVLSQQAENTGKQTKPAKLAIPTIPSLPLDKIAGKQLAKSGSTASSCMLSENKKYLVIQQRRKGNKTFYKVIETVTKPSLWTEPNTSQTRERETNATSANDSSATAPVEVHAVAGPSTDNISSPSAGFKNSGTDSDKNQNTTSIPSPMPGPCASEVPSSQEITSPPTSATSGGNVTSSMPVPGPVSTATSGENVTSSMPGPGQEPTATSGDSVTSSMPLPGPEPIATSGDIVTPSMPVPGPVPTETSGDSVTSSMPGPGPVPTATSGEKVTSSMPVPWPLPTSSSESSVTSSMSVLGPLTTATPGDNVTSSMPLPGPVPSENTGLGDTSKSPGPTSTEPMQPSCPHEKISDKRNSREPVKRKASEDPPPKYSEARRFKNKRGRKTNALVEEELKTAPSKPKLYTLNPFCVPVSLLGLGSC